MNDKKVIRIAVSERAKQVIEGWSEQQDMTEVGVASRIYEWFGSQSEDIQRAILGLYGSRTPDVAKMALQELAQPDGVSSVSALAGE